MAERPLIGSLERIEAALDRIEAQAALLAQPAVDAQAPAEAQVPDADLRERHQQLQVSVATALSRIDALLAGESTPMEGEPAA